MRCNRVRLRTWQAASIVAGSCLVLAFTFSAIGWVNRTALADVEPLTVKRTIVPGGSTTVDKGICTPEVVPRPKVYILADTTGSMADVLASIQANGAALIAAIVAEDPDAQFGAGQYKDFPFDAFAFQNQASITDDGGAAALAAIATWSAGGGSDGSEGQFFALKRIADNVVGFPADPTCTRIVVWFGDAPAHDPVCNAISGFADITEASVTQDLIDAKIRVVAISTITAAGAFFPDALDDSPTAFAGDYVADCGVENGSSGQASRIAAATGGVHLTDVPADEIADAILAGIKALPVTVTPCVVDCDKNLTVTFDKNSASGTSGDCFDFVETIAVDPGAPQCDAELHCKVIWKINGQPVTLADGTLDPKFVEEIWITVPDVEPPVVVCPADKEFECDGKDDALNAWKAEFTAKDNCPDLIVDFACVSAPGCGGTGTTKCTITATDKAGQTSSCSSTFTTVDNTPPVISCDAEDIKPKDAPITFCATATDVCCDDEPFVEITGFRCFANVGTNNREIDKSESCIVSVDGACITISDGGGVGTTIQWTVAATDCCGNTKEKICSVKVLHPGA